MVFKKWGKCIYLICFSLILGLFCSPITVSADDAINGIDITVELMDDGSANITQVWDSNRSSGTEGYIPQSNLGDISIENFSVSDETGLIYENIGEWDVDASLEDKAGKYGINGSGDDLELCWGIGSYGQHTYTLSYTMTNFVKAYSDGEFGFYSRFVNDQLSAPPERVSVTIQKADVELSEENAKIWGFGYVGDIVFSDGSIVAQSSEPLVFESHVTALVWLDPEIVPAAAPSDLSFSQVENMAQDGSDYDTSDGDNYNEQEYNGTENWVVTSSGFPALLGMIIPFGFVALFFIVYSSRKNSGFRLGGSNLSFAKDDITYYRDIPFDGALPPSYYALESCRQLGNKSDIISAYFLRWIKSGAITIENRPKKTFLGIGNKTETSLVFRDAITLDDPAEKKLYDIMLSAAGSDRILQEKELRKWSTKNYTTLSSWFDTATSTGKKHYDMNGLLSDQEHSSFFGLFKHTVKEMNEAGKQSTLELLGFKKYLQDFTLVNEREAKEVQLWDDYLIFAALFGIADKVAKEFKELNPQYFESSIYMQNDMDFFVTYMILNNLSRASYHGMQSGQSSEASRNSGGGGGASFGGGGGGFSGGGSGGGFR